MITTGIPLRDLPAAWPKLWPLLAPAVKRSRDFATERRERDLLARLIAGDAQLWAVVEDATPVAAVVTQITLEPERRCLLWQVGARPRRSGGSARLRDWAPGFLAAIDDWALSHHCVALWGVGRPGWSRLVGQFGGRRIADVDGQPAWERRIG